MNEVNNITQDKGLLNEDRINRFMQGTMSADEEAVFQEELKTNEELRNQAIAQARLVKGMKQIDDELKDAFRRTDEQTIKNIAHQATGSKKQVTRWLAIAASVVFIIFVGFKAYDYYDTTTLGKEYANTFPISSIIRGETDTNINTELTSLFNKVSNAEDLDNATSRLAVLWEQAKQDTYNDYTDYAPYIGWYLAIGYLENYEKESAKAILGEMKEMYPEGIAIGDRVRALRSKL